MSQCHSLSTVFLRLGVAVLHRREYEWLYSEHCDELLQMGLRRTGWLPTGACLDRPSVLPGRLAASDGSAEEVSVGNGGPLEAHACSVRV